MVASNSGPRKPQGRRKGFRNWKDPEVDLLLVDCVESEKPCGTKQWENVAASMFMENKYQRSSDACKKKFDKLWSTEKPTGSSEVPRHVLRAQVVKENISRECCFEIFL